MTGMRKPNGERGAILIHVAISIIALLCFLAFVADYGMMWVARRQAQNAADAGALAGAAEMMFDLTRTDAATQAAQVFAGQQNVVWGQQTAVGDIVVSPLPFACPASAGGGNACIRVDVMRGVPDRAGTVHTNTMPTYFGRLFGMNQQGVRATATAQIAAGNSVQCIKPWMVVDKWVDNTTDPALDGEGPGWDQMDTFNPAHDVYTKPGYRAMPGTSPPIPADIGLQLMLKGDAGIDPSGTWSSGWSMRVELGGGNGSANYVDEIQGCPSWVPEIGLYAGQECDDRPDQDFERGCINVRPGVSQGPTVKQGVDYLVGLDRTARWDTNLNKIVSGCTDAGNCQAINPEGNDFSPRIIPLALFDPLACVTSSCNTGNNTVAQVTNIMGFFLEGTCDDVFAGQTMPAWCGTGGQPNKTVVGRIMNYPGSSSRASGSAGPWSFIRVLRLVQ
jgi:hypothetical protein